MFDKNRSGSKQKSYPNRLDLPKMWVIWIKSRFDVEITNAPIQSLIVYDARWVINSRKFLVQKSQKLVRWVPIRNQIKIYYFNISNSNFMHLYSCLFKGRRTEIPPPQFRDFTTRNRKVHLGYFIRRSTFTKYGNLPNKVVLPFEL